MKLKITVWNVFTISRSKETKSSVTVCLANNQILACGWIGQIFTFLLTWLIAAGKKRAHLKDAISTKCHLRRFVIAPSRRQGSLPLSAYWVAGAVFPHQTGKYLTVGESRETTQRLFISSHAGRYIGYGAMIHRRRRNRNSLNPNLIIDLSGSQHLLTASVLPRRSGFCTRPSSRAKSGPECSGMNSGRTRLRRLWNQFSYLSSSSID